MRSAFKAEFAAFSPARSVDSRKLTILLPFGREKDRMTGDFAAPGIGISLTKDIGDHPVSRQSKSANCVRRARDMASVGVRQKATVVPR